MEWGTKLSLSFFKIYDWKTYEFIILKNLKGSTYKTPFSTTWHSQVVPNQRVKSNSILRILLFYSSVVAGSKLIDISYLIKKPTTTRHRKFSRNLLSSIVRYDIYPKSADSNMSDNGNGIFSFESLVRTETPFYGIMVLTTV